MRQCNQVAGGGLRWQVAGKTSSGLGSQLIGHRVRVFRFGCGCGPEPVPGAEHLNLRPEGRDLGPETASARHLPPEIECR